MSDRLPSGYVPFEGVWGSACWNAAGRWLQQALVEHRDLYTWASSHPDAQPLRGRGPAYALPAPTSGPEGRPRWVVRHYRRGGAMAGLLGDRYVRVGKARPIRELAASAAARSRGVRTPAVVAGVSYPDGFSYRCDLVTEFVPAASLADVLHATDGTRDWSDAMAAAGALIDELASVGVFHVDLNAHNVIIPHEPSDRASGGPSAWAVDFDRARILRGPSRSAADRMTARLTRSIVKVGTPTGEPLGVREVMTALGADSR